jgi:hypothetical protein
MLAAGSLDLTLELAKFALLVLIHVGPPRACQNHRSTSLDTPLLNQVQTGFSAWFSHEIRSRAYCEGSVSNSKV